MNNLSIYGSYSENSEDFVEFIISLLNLKSMLFRNNINLNVFNPNCSKNKINLNNLGNLHYIHENEFLNYFPDFFNLKSIRYLIMGYEYKEGSIKKLSLNESLKNIQSLSLDKFKIGTLL
ncbi:hypothetical protein CWI37_0655p0030 [Hamiltosporidium tvaerminnensis]|uniref:Uncharacterized protein n=2 Tax=Hamiltosporidium TaxID=1176354 RepID=A0A4Q9LEH1_9MICR|nr:hypothetical protein CWI37_0655p0030 [Hamiltosporidium tvaerminnensis]TBU06393.1 hypothetical protein CWI39_0503p0030 [Hamiltosporidium magnivora]